MQHTRSQDGTPLAFERTGEGPPLILVGGALSDRQGGTALAARLASRFSVYTYDRRGRGDSGDTAPYAVEREVEDLDALVREAGGQAYGLGFSSGAVLALEAADRGVTFTKLALYEPPLILDALLAADQRGDAVAYFLTAAKHGTLEGQTHAAAPEAIAPVLERFFAD